MEQVVIVTNAWHVVLVSVSWCVSQVTVSAPPGTSDYTDYTALLSSLEPPSHCSESPASTARPAHSTLGKLRGQHQA